jgi:hypothetical protein
MKKSIFLLATVLILAMVAVVAIAFAANPKPVFKVGETVYACNCPEGCPCQTISKHQGKCPCGTEMVKATVEKVEKGKVVLKAEGWEKPRTYSTIAKYACNCGPKCDCDTISQQAGKCPCGAEMKEVK